MKSIVVENPIDLNNYGKETIMDLKLTLSNNEIMNIELQVYADKYWIMRSILYLCRAFDSIGSGDNYSKLMPTTHICITDQELFPDETPEFYAQYLLLNTKTHKPYTKNFGINVLQLNHTKEATTEDINNNLVYWAKIFKATTWEDFKALARGNSVIEEVGNMMFKLNTDNQAKELLEGQRRYREMMSSQYTAGYTDAEEQLQAVIAEKEATIADRNAAIAYKDAEIAEKEAVIANKDYEIAKLKEELELLKNK